MGACEKVNVQLVSCFIMAPPRAYGNTPFDPHQWVNIFCRGGWVQNDRRQMNGTGWTYYQEVDCHDIDTENRRDVSKMEKKK